MKVELISKTVGLGEYAEGDIEQLMIAQARVSSSRENPFEDHAKLLRYCLQEGHWSVFEMASLTFRIETSRAIGRELLRHRSFTFQELSQRYAVTQEVEYTAMRKQARTNRQSSEALSAQDGRYSDDIAQGSIDDATKAYKTLIEMGVARETARFVLPEATKTILYMKGDVRSWITFLNVRLHKTAQLEMREIAKSIGAILALELPVTYQALNRFKGAEQYHILDQLSIAKQWDALGEIGALWGLEKKIEEKRI